MIDGIRRREIGLPFFLVQAGFYWGAWLLVILFTEPLLRAADLEECSTSFNVFRTVFLAFGVLALAAAAFMSFLGCFRLPQHQMILGLICLFSVAAAVFTAWAAV